MRKLSTGYRSVFNLALVCTALVASSSVGFAQAGKPLYTMTVFQSGDTLGEIDLELYPDVAPNHVRNFDSLVSIGFYDGTAFHRVIPRFMIQGGDPNSRSGPESTWGSGDPSQTRVDAEFSPIKHVPGILSTARTPDPNSATSQFFIMVAEYPSLDGQYTVQGRVVRGQSVADAIVNTPTKNDQAGNKTRPIDKVTMAIRRTGLDTSILASPRALYPSDDTTRVKSGTVIRWTSVDSTILYYVEISENPEFTTLIANEPTLDTSMPMSGLPMGPRRLYWRVGASNGGRRAYSETRSFVTALSAPVLVSPGSNATNVVKPVRLVWRAHPSPVRYRLQVSTNSGFTAVILDPTDLTDTSMRVFGLEPSKRYYWRVFATNDAGDTMLSISRTFTTDAAASIDADDVADISLDVVASNDGEHALRVTFARSENARITVVDARGNEAIGIPMRQFAAGRHNVMLATRSLPSGTYFVRIESASGSATERFAIVR